ncbi:MAG: hypothetical protein O3B21_11585 [Proteobacteria bacterium]|nr:hypothetical protein [Pseudomonadota bacterium]
MKTRHLVLSLATAGLLAACSQSGFRNVDTTLDNAVGDAPVIRLSSIEKHASGGNAAAQRMLGNMHYWGEYVEQSETQAVAWWNRAAEKGDEEAQHNLSMVAAGQPVKGEMTSDVGKKYWASMEEGYFAFTDDFDTMVLPFQDAAFGEDPAAEEEPSVLEKVMSPVGKLLTDVVSFVGSTVKGE